MKSEIVCLLKNQHVPVNDFQLLEKFLNVLGSYDLEVFRKLLGKVKSLKRSFEVFIHAPADSIESVIIVIYYLQNTNSEEARKDIQELYEFLRQSKSKTLLSCIGFASLFEDI